MKRTKWIVGVRNKLASIAMECDSAAAIEETKMSEEERRILRSWLRSVIDWIDEYIKV